MLLGPVAPTDYDWNFRIGRIPVTVSVWFWAGSAFLGLNSLRAGVEYLLAWIVVVFISILVHELGHAWTAQAFGFRPRIMLYQFGGLAMYDLWGPLARWKSIAISFAGPLAGFCLCGLTLIFSIAAYPHLIPHLSGRSLSVMNEFVGQMIFVNLVWGLINLLPVLPLDGGRIAQQIFGWFSPRQGDRFAMIFGIVVGGGAAALFFATGNTFAAILFAMLTAQNLAALQNPYLR